GPGAQRALMNGTAPSTNFSADRVVAAVVVSAEACVSVTGNTLVLFVSLWDDQVKRHRSSLLVVSLAVTDLLSATLVMVPSACALTYEVGRWATGPSAPFTVLTLAMIALDRGLAIQKPLEYVQRSTWRRVAQMVAFPWTLGIVFALVPACLDWTAYQFDNIVCDVDWHPRHEHVLYYAATFSLCFAAPAVVVLVQYARILLSVRRLREMVAAPVTNGAACSSGRPPLVRRHSDSQKILLSILTVIVIFFVCIIPFCFTKLVKVLLGPQAIPNWLDMMSTIIQFLASVANPFVYSIGLKNFQDALCRLTRAGRDTSALRDPEALSHLQIVLSVLSPHFGLTGKRINI
ncbi:hypothetical protein HPB47_016618, partial [Ixodes persulcatus]